MKLFIFQVFAQAPPPCGSSFCPLILSKSSRALPCPNSHFLRRALPTATALQRFPISRSSLSFSAHFMCQSPPHKGGSCVFSAFLFLLTAPNLQKHFHCFNENQHFQKSKVRYFLPTLPKLISQDTLVLWDKRRGSRGEGVLWSKTLQKN